MCEKNSAKVNRVEEWPPPTGVQGLTGADPGPPGASGEVGPQAQAVGHLEYKPQVCIDKECSCIWHDHCEVFCIGQTPWHVDVIDDDAHRNDFQFCITSPHRGWEKHRINRDDMDLIMKAMFSGLSKCTNNFNLHFYLSETPFYMDGDTVRLGKDDC